MNSSETCSISVQNMRSVWLSSLKEAEQKGHFYFYHLIELHCEIYGNVAFQVHCHGMV